MKRIHQPVLSNCIVLCHRKCLILWDGLLNIYLQNKSCSSLHGCVFRYSTSAWWLTALVSASWLECDSIAAGACPLQAWLPRRFVYPHKAFSCIAVNAIACPKPSPPGNTTMILTSECYNGPPTCYCKVNLEDGLVLFGSELSLITSDKQHWLFETIVWKSEMVFRFSPFSFYFSVDASVNCNVQSRQQVPSFLAGDSKPNLSTCAIQL